MINKSDNSNNNNNNNKNTKNEKYEQDINTTKQIRDNIKNEQYLANKLWQEQTLNTNNILKNEIRFNMKQNQNENTIKYMIFKNNTNDTKYN